LEAGGEARIASVVGILSAQALTKCVGVEEIMREERGWYEQEYLYTVYGKTAKRGLSEERQVS